MVHRLEEVGLATGRRPVEHRTAAHARLVRALEVMQTLIAQLGGDGSVAPQALQHLEVMLTEGTPASVGVEPRTGSKTAAPTNDEARSENTNERLTVLAAEVDEALRLASAVARGTAALNEQLQGGAAPGAASIELVLAAERLEGLLFNMRLLPAAEVLAGLDGEVRELASRLNKQVALRVSGQEVRADRRTLQTARTMVRHLIRNAIDHGLEAPERREATGKPSQGTLQVAMAMMESQLEVRVDDDGRGFDAVTIRKKLAGREGEAARVAALSDDEALTVEFAISGGSTRESATDISGRGIGLSAVVAMARSRGGDFLLRSQAGRGSSLRFTLPLEVYTAEVLTVLASGRRFGIPVASVEGGEHSIGAEVGAVRIGEHKRVNAGVGVLGAGDRVGGIGRPGDTRSVEAPLVGKWRPTGSSYGEGYVRAEVRALALGLGNDRRQGRRLAHLEVTEGSHRCRLSVRRRLRAEHRQGPSAARSPGYKETLGVGSLVNVGGDEVEGGAVIVESHAAVGEGPIAIDAAGGGDAGVRYVWVVSSRGCRRDCLRR